MPATTANTMTTTNPTTTKSTLEQQWKPDLAAWERRLAALRLERQDHAQRCPTRRLERIDRLAASRAVLEAHRRQCFKVRETGLDMLRQEWAATNLLQHQTAESRRAAIAAARRRLRSVFATTMTHHTKAYDLVLKECLAQPQRDQRHAADLQRHEHELTDRIETITTMLATGRAPAA
jgi:hypothetical protein